MTIEKCIEAQYKKRRLSAISERDARMSRFFIPPKGFKRLSPFLHPDIINRKEIDSFPKPVYIAPSFEKMMRPLILCLTVPNKGPEKSTGLIPSSRLLFVCFLI
jgi:hypothetical protein